MNEQDRILIERYFRNELDVAERQAFEQRLESDDVFREEVRLHRLALAAIDLHGKEERKKTLSARPLLNGQSPRRRWLLWMLPLLAAFAIWYWQSGIKDDQPPIVPEPAPKPDTAQAPQLHNRLPLSPPPQQPVVTPANGPKLFAEAYKPYTDVASSERSGGNRSQGDSAQRGSLNPIKQFTAEGKFKESLEAYDQLAPELQQKDAALFYKANSLLALGREREAAPIFESIAVKLQGSYVSHAQWYAAMCALKRADLKSAKNWLTRVRNNKNASVELRAEADQLLQGF